MKKVIKIASFFLLAFIMIITFNDRVYAKTCAEYSYVPGTCPDGKADSEGYICISDQLGNCARSRKVKKCSEYTGDDTCPQVSEAGELCGIRPGNKCVPLKIARDCTQYDVGSCPTKDELRNTCDPDSEGCKIVKTAEICTSLSLDNCSGIDDYGNICRPIDGKCAISQYNKAKDVKECSDYSGTNISLCPNGGKDSFGNTCKADYSHKECFITKNSNESKSFKVTCETFNTENGTIPCPEYDDYQRKCDLNYSTGKCFSTMKDPTFEEQYDVSLIAEDEPFKCSDVEIFTKAWLFIRVLAPFLIVLFGSLDFFKSLVAGDEKQMKQARGKIFKRLIAFLLLIILPFVIQLIFSLMGTYGSQNVCLVKCIATNDTSDTPCSK